MPDAKMVQDLVRNYKGNDTLERIAARANMDHQRLKNIMSNRIKRVTDSEVVSVAAALGVNAPIDRLPFLVQTPMTPVRVVGSASAGPGSEFHPDDYEIYVPSAMCSQDSVAWEAEGDSMSPWVLPGDVIIVRPHKQPRIGFPMLVRDSEGKTLLKMVDMDGGRIILRSLNIDYPPRSADVEYLGYMTGRYRYVAGYQLIESEMSGLRPLA